MGLKPPAPSVTPLIANLYSLFPMPYALCPVPYSMIPDPCLPGVHFSFALNRSPPLRG